MEQPVSFGKYTLHQRLAVGAIAEIYRATVRTAEGQDLSMVVKKIRDEVANDGDLVARFVDEARTISMLDHPNIVKALEWGRQASTLFIAMELVEGVNLASLAETMAQQKIRFPPTTAVYILTEVLAALAYAHTLKDPYGNGLGLVHRDVSPPNIVISVSGQIKLVDFGLAKVTAKLRATVPGVFQGKYGYMAPEVLDQKQVDGRADLFSVGATLYELLTGFRLPQAADAIQAGVVIQAVQQRPPSSVHADIPNDLDEFLLRAMAENPEQRPDSAEQMLAELKSFLGRWDRQVDASSLASFLQEVASGKIKGEKKAVGFAFGEATSQWMAQGDQLQERVFTDPAAEAPPADFSLIDPASAPEPEPEPESAPSSLVAPSGKFSRQDTVMAIEQGGLGRGRLWKTLAAVLAVAAGITLVVMFVVQNLTEQPESQPTPAPAAEPSQTDKFAGAVQVFSDPPGAIIFVDGQQVEPAGKPPRIMGLRAGQRQFKLVVPGYLPWDGPVELRTGKSLEIRKKLAERHGNLVLKSTPKGALVFWNGKRVGRTPKKLEKISTAKTHRLVLRKGRRLTSRFSVGPADWPADPAQDLIIEKKLSRSQNKKRRR